MRKLIFFIISLLPITVHLNGNSTDLPFTNSVYDQRIRSVQLYREGWNLSYPVMKLNSDERLVLNFDLLSDNIENYVYTFIHCDKDWNRSDIFSNEYLEGFPDNPIEDFSPSFNTTVDYIHYRLLFPNDRIKITLSGNYILYIYPADDQDNPVLTQRFEVTEDAVKVKIDMHRPMTTTNDNTGQQIDFRVNIAGLNIIDPYRDIYSFILQNGRWDNAKMNLKPEISGGSELIYNSLSDKNIFDGGNEFRYFDIRSIKYLSEFIVKIDYMAPNYHFYLKPSENRQLKPYFYSQDFNGKYYIASSEGREADTDADYVYVWFTLPAENKLSGKSVYVTGNLTGWSPGEDNLMRYNEKEGQYECEMLLKQGWYNYAFGVLGDDGTPVTPSIFEGSHYETENDYMILVYYRAPGTRYDRLLTAASANSLNNLSY